MNNDTQEQAEERQRDRKIRFDGTITLGNVITMIGMFGTIMALWRNMEQRVILVEERQAVQARTVEKLLDNVERLALVQAALSRNEKGN